MLSPYILMYLLNEPSDKLKYLFLIGQETDELQFLERSLWKTVEIVLFLLDLTDKLIQPRLSNFTALH